METIQRYDATLEHSDAGAFMRYADHIAALAAKDDAIAALKGAVHADVVAKAVQKERE